MIIQMIYIDQLRLNKFGDVYRQHPCCLMQKTSYFSGYLSKIAESGMDNLAAKYSSDSIRDGPSFCIHVSSS